VKFPWINMRAGLPAKPRPAIRCVFRNGSTRLPSGVLAILDTGADSTVLPKRFASLLGYSDVHLDEIRIMSIGATITAWRVRDVTGAAVKIGGVWVDLSCLMFVEGTPALLGRDVVLANFDLLMRQGQTELRPRKK
jgi:predicted aspartyl protease